MENSLYNESHNKAITLLERGEATVAEAARLAGVARQLVRHWAMRAGVNPMAARRDYLRTRWQRLNRK